MKDWCEIMGIECVHISKDTKEEEFKKELFYNDIAWKLKNL
jgi:L-arabinose isomerase